MKKFGSIFLSCILCASMLATTACTEKQPSTDTESFIETEETTRGATGSVALTESETETETETELLFDPVIDTAGCRILYNGTSMQKRFAWYMHDALKAVNEAFDFKIEKKKEGRVLDAFIEFREDDSMQNGDFKIKAIAENGIRVHVGDYYGFTGAARALSAAIDENGIIRLGESVVSGNYQDHLKDYEQASAYAYQDSAEYRVMFYNVLWITPDVNERNNLNAEVIGEYLPDVLGLQEMNKTRRGNESDGKGGLVALLEEMSYAEAVDPRVKNMYPATETIPGTDSGAVTGAITLSNMNSPANAFNQEYANRTSGKELEGYGTAGGTKVTVDGETYYTYFNCSPLFYNTETTRCIEAGYYWYKYQWDLRSCTDCARCKNGTHTDDDSHHVCSAGDAASKSATWGIFESIETGERYIVISTHMCTRSNYIKHLQAKELVTLIDELTETYDYPVILGGDYNGNYSQPNYIYFTETADYTDVERNKLASLYTTDTIRAHHPAPIEGENGFVTEDKSKESIIYRPDQSVDHIVLGKGTPDRLDITVYGIIVDELTLAGSDHFPIYMDFSIK